MNWKLLWEEFWTFIEREIITKKTMDNPAEPANQTQTTPVRDMLIEFCLALRDYEGAPGSLNYQLNNPGDCRCSPVGYAPMYGIVQCIDTDTNPKYLYHVGKFAKFPTYELGWNYLLNLVHQRALLHPDWTIIDFFTNYSPSSDNNNPDAYAHWVANRLGVPASTMLKDLFKATV